jgi:hypothetical protein
MSSNFPALSVQGPQQPDILGTYGRLMQIKNMQQQQQLGAQQQQIGNVSLQEHQLDLQNAQRAQQDQLKLTAAYQQSGGDLDKFLGSLPTSGASATAIQKTMEGVVQARKAVADMQESEFKNHVAMNNSLGPLLQKVSDAKPEDRPAVYQQVHQAAMNDPLLFPVAMKQPMQYPGDDAFGMMAAQFKTSDQLIKEREVAAQEKAASARMISATKPPTTPVTDQPLSDAQVSQINQGLTQRWQVLNPGKPLPASSTLQSGATQGDFQRINSVMEATERASATKASQDAAAAQRADTNARQKQTQADTEEQKGIKWVTWTDPSGKTVAGPLSMAKSAGASDAAELPGQEVRDVQNARHYITMVNKQGDPSKPETMGTLQLIDSLDKDGKLGIMASRWNNFLARGIGAQPGDDPRITTLLNKGDLGQSLAMLSHFGASGGRSPQMLKHFQDMANAGKMDAGTLRAGIKAMSDYMGDRAMLPATSGSAQISVTAPNGKTYSFPDQASADAFKQKAGIK